MLRYPCFVNFPSSISLFRYFPQRKLTLRKWIDSLRISLLSMTGREESEMLKKLCSPVGQEQTLFKDGCKSVKMLSLNELIENMRTPGVGKPVAEFHEKLQGYSPGCPCPASAKLPCVVFGAGFRKRLQANGSPRQRSCSGFANAVVLHSVTRQSTLSVACCAAIMWFAAMSSGEIIKTKEGVSKYTD